MITFGFIYWLIGLREKLPCKYFGHDFSEAYTDFGPNGVYEDGIETTSAHYAKTHIYCSRCAHKIGQVSMTRGI